MKYSKKTTDVFFYKINILGLSTSVYMQMTATKHLSANLQKFKILQNLVTKPVRQRITLADKSNLNFIKMAQSVKIWR